MEKIGGRRRRTGVSSGVVGGVGSRINKKKQPCFQLTYEQGGDNLFSVIRDALGEDNRKNYHSNIFDRKFPGISRFTSSPAQVWVEPFLDSETSKQAVFRLQGLQGSELANRWDLARFLALHVKEVEKWACVIAGSDDSQIACSNLEDHLVFSNEEHFCVPFVQSHNQFRRYDILDLYRPLGPACGILMVRKRRDRQGARKIRAGEEV